MKINLKHAAATVLSAILAASTIFLTFSCSDKGKVPEAEFATFIKSYTGGVITDNSSIKVEFTSNIPSAEAGAPVKDDVFSFSPSVKGSARWISSDVIEFVPESGALKPGQAYSARLRLDKVMKIKDGKFKKFDFSFLVSLKEAVLNVDNMLVAAASPDEAEVRGTIALSEELPLEKVREMLDFDYPGGGSAEVESGADPQHFHFTISSLARNASDKTLRVGLKSGNTGFKTTAKKEIVIPGKDGFKVTGAKLVQADDPYIYVELSQPLAEIAARSGYITVGGAGRAYYQQQDNVIKVFYESAGREPISISLSEDIRDVNGNRLGQPFHKEFVSDEIKPAVELLVNGNILPNPRELILPFRAVNLKAVDLSVVKIYEDNVLMFLQENDLDDSYSLRRSGRMTYKKCIRLDSDPSVNLHEWQDFAIDLSDLFKEEPGAIYRLRLSFNKDYSVYGQGADFAEKNSDSQMIKLSAGSLTDEELAVWDNPSPYFYEDFYDWEEYDWDDRDNPLKPTYYMDSDKYPVFNLMTSNLGVIAKSSGNGKLWVSVSDILTAKPVFGADVTAYNYQLRPIASDRTGTDGMVELQTEGTPFAVVVKRNNATSYLKVNNGNEKSLSRFDVGGKVLEKGLKSFIYGERGVWRPGDTLHLTMILEDKDDRIPDNHPVTMEIYTPQGQFYCKQICTDALNGFYSFTVPTSADDPTGTWNSYFKIGGATFHKPLKIETIKPNRLKVNVDMGTEVLSAGTTTPVKINSNWLTGPAAAGMTTKIDMTLSKTSGGFKGYEDYNFTNPASQFTRSESRIVEARLDPAGQTLQQVKMPKAEGAPGMLSATLVCSVEEPGGDASYTTMTMPFSPYSAYVGLKVPSKDGSSWLETDSDQILKVAVLDKNGERVRGDKLEYRIYKLSWSWWWESRSEDFDSYVNGTSANLISSGELISGNNDSNITFRVDYPEWGRYLVYVKDKNSGHATGQIIYADWPAYRGRSAKSDPTSLTMLSFTTDKTSYDVGEQVTVYIPENVSGKALVSLENSRTVISRKWVDVDANGETAFKFKVTPEMAPNFYIHVTMLQPHDRSDNDLPVRLYGVQPVLVNNKDSHLAPEITMADSVHPEEEFTVKVKEKNGKPMTYTLAIVDEGLLDITAFKTPDPWNTMYMREALGVKTWDLYDQVIGAFSGRFSPMLSIGGDEDIQMGNKKDNRFNPVVKFLGPFSLSGGTNTHKITLPMYVGSVRVMVVAGQDGAYGNAQKDVTVKSPIVIMPTLPRVLGTGENVTMPVNVFAMEDGVRNANVSVKVEGPVEIVGNASESLSFDKPGDKLTAFNLKATGEGVAKITVNADGSGHKTSETISIEVRNPNPSTVTSEHQLINAGKSARFSWTPFTAGEGEGARLELASFPVIDFNGAFSYLNDYSYTCTEQIAAQGIAMIWTLDLLSEENAAKAKEKIPVLLRELYARQLPDGGFSYWPGVVNPDLWATSMAGAFMATASGKGFDVSKAVLSSWKSFQKKNAQSWKNSDKYYLYDLLQAYRLYTLALAGEADNSAMNRLKGTENLSVQARWMLASTYALTGKKNISKELMNGLNTEFDEYSPNNLTFGSSLRDKAIALETLVLTDDLGQALELASEVAEELPSYGYMTQTLAFTSVAMGRLSQKVNTGALKTEISQKGKSEAFNSAKAVGHKAVDASEGEVSVKNSSDGPVYATLVTVRKPAYGEIVPAKASGIEIIVKYALKDGTPVNPSELKQGTDFTATVTVRNPSVSVDQTNLALMQMIPSGWEIVNDRLFSGDAASSGAAYSYCDIRDDRVLYYFNLGKGTSKTFKTNLRAAYEGSYVLPSVTCEAMYDNKVNACTASGTAKVVR